MNNDLLILSKTIIMFIYLTVLTFCVQKMNVQFMIKIKI